jgi:hypothetical protein
MKRIIRLSLVVLCLPLAGRVVAAEPAAGQLVRQLPAISDVIVWESQLSAIWAKPLGTREQIALTEPIHQKLKAAEVTYKALARMINAGDSVYDIPGLLAAGRLHYNAGKDTYELGLGTWDGAINPADPKERCVFVFIFDRTGRILSKHEIEPEL